MLCDTLRDSKLSPNLRYHLNPTISQQFLGFKKTVIFEIITVLQNVVISD